MIESHSNFLLVHNMLIETTKLLRQKFLYLFKEFYNIEWTDNGESEFFKKGAGKEIRNSCKKLQKTYLESGNSNEWDITLLCTILSSKLFLSTKLYSHHLIKKLLSVRNQISHSATLEISDEAYKELSIELTSTMLELGASKQFVLELKNNKGFQIVSKAEPDKNAHLLKESGNKEFKKTNYQHAVEIYTTAIILPNLNYQELGVLYRNRSLSYLKCYEETRNEINLDRALADAKKTCFYQPVWFKGYAQLGEIYHIMNELEKGVKNYEKALAFSMNNEDVKNSLASLKVKLGEQQRHEHLIQLPLSTEEHEEQMLMKLQNFVPNCKNSSLYLSEIKNLSIKEDPILKDVWTGHEYRDGSKNVKQNYETAAKYYTKAAQSNNAEGMYNLACLTMKGLGVKKDFKAAFHLLNEAVKQNPVRKLLGSNIPNVGVKEAEHLLGLAYQEGTYVPKNEKVASNWYHLAVQHGCSQSANNLGLMYLYGNGVSKNFTQAKKLFNFAHENGDVNASSNLVKFYILELQADKALEWHEIALQKSYLSKMEDLRIRKEIENIKKLQNFEGFNEKILPITKYLKNFESSLYIPSAISLKSREFNLKELRSNAKNGSITANKMLNALHLFYSALDMFNNKNVQIEEFIRNLANAFITCQIVCQLSNIMIADVLKIVNSFIQEEKSEIDYFARICFAYLNCGDYNLVINFLTSSLKIYPDDSEMLHLLGCNYSFLHQYENAFKAFEKAYSFDPTNYEYIYSKAVVLRLLECSDAKHFYEKFISTAPSDHRKIPDAYYGIGLCSIEKNKECVDLLNSSTLILFYYNKGLENEKLQLSCFLPYESNAKKCLEVFLNISNVDSKTFADSLPKIVESSYKGNNALVDYKRKDTIINHRKMFDTVKGYQKKHFFYKKTTFKPIKMQSAPTSIVGLKEVFFEDIDFTKDCILTGRVLTVTVIDIPIVGLLTSVHFVVEDDNEFVAKLCIYNLGDDYPSIKKEFPVGCIFSIINPYVRLAIDGKPMIRVDDPNSVIMSGKIKIDMCLYCGKEKSKYTCSKCKIAKYCSKECQNNDWKILEHKNACNYLSAYCL